MSYSDLDPKTLANSPRSYNPQLTDRKAVDIANGNASSRGYTVENNTTAGYKTVTYDLNVDSSTGAIVDSSGVVTRVPAGTNGTYNLPAGSTLIVDSKNIASAATSTNERKLTKEMLEVVPWWLLEEKIKLEENDQQPPDNFQRLKRTFLSIGLGDQCGGWEKNRLSLNEIERQMILLSP